MRRSVLSRSSCAWRSRSLPAPQTRRLHGAVEPLGPELQDCGMIRPGDSVETALATPSNTCSTRSGSRPTGAERHFSSLAQRLAWRRRSGAARLTAAILASPFLMFTLAGTNSRETAASASRGATAPRDACAGLRSRQAQQDHACGRSVGMEAAEDLGSPVAHTRHGQARAGAAGMFFDYTPIRPMAVARGPAPV